MITRRRLFQFARRRSGTGPDPVHVEPVADAAPTAVLPAAVGAPTFHRRGVAAFVGDDGRVEVHAREGTYRRHGDCWVFHPADRPAEIVDVMAADTLDWLRWEADRLDDLEHRRAARAEAAEGLLDRAGWPS